MHGHFDSQFFPLDVSEDAMGKAGINMGIGIVVPVDKILEVIGHPAIQALDKANEDQLYRQSLPKMDAGSQGLG